MCPPEGKGIPGKSKPAKTPATPGSAFGESATGQTKTCDLAWWLDRPRSLEPIASQASPDLNQIAMDLLTAQPEKTGQRLFAATDVADQRRTVPLVQEPPVMLDLEESGEPVHFCFSQGCRLE